ncbi:diacylglycerol kinase [Vibrio furnissii]|uniref:diacylglycerol kinase n=1 Tax=Vibrio furnissii TaxID=29494 RepID=UPI0001B91843|nr:diacylglycerol kinase [Vibrio furnissii]EEX42670.1 diacylglycerol kinase [Vibrio furnissii CIP 102972]QDC91625.1 diacylglycerol kinase [Vibrio furnissii]UON47005.1 diacylglycerol kinase [Vibrio furnissii]SUP46996.1 diacylglycerol kinase [Vibrio furnissii]
MQQKNPQGIKRVIKATRYSYQGLCAALKHEAAFREEAILAGVLIPLAVWLDVTQLERMLMIGTVLLVMVVELLNSAVEAVVDRIGSEQHELAGRAKDMGSAAVFVAMAICGYVWVEALFI